jgi:hypothetical protein
MSGLSLFLSDDIDRDLHCRNRSSVPKPVCGVPILGPAHSRPIVRSDSKSMVSDRALQHVDGAWSVFMVVNRAEDASRLDGHHTHSKLASCHTLDLRTKVNRCKWLHRHTVRLRCPLFIVHRALLPLRPGPNVAVNRQTMAGKARCGLPGRAAGWTQPLPRQMTANRIRSSPRRLCGGCGIRRCCGHHRGLLPRGWDECGLGIKSALHQSPERSRRTEFRPGTGTSDRSATRCDSP